MFFDVLVYHPITDIDFDYKSLCWNGVQEIGKESLKYIPKRVKFNDQWKSTLNTGIASLFTIPLSTRIFARTSLLQINFQSPPRETVTSQVTFSHTQMQVWYRNYYSIWQWYTLFLYLRSDATNRGFEPRTSGIQSKNSTIRPRDV